MKFLPHLLRSTLQSRSFSARIYTSLRNVRPLRLDPETLPFSLKKPFVDLLKAIRSANLGLLEQTRPDRNFSSLQHPTAESLLLVNLLLEGLWKLSRVEDAERTFQELLGQGLKPSFVTVEIMLDGALRHGRVETARSLDQVYEKYGLWPSPGHYNHWISFHLANVQLDQAYSVLQEMRHQSQKPNATTFNIFLKFFIKWSDWTAAERIQLAMDREGITPGLLYYCSLLRTLFLKNSLADVQVTLDKALLYLQKADRNSRYVFYNTVVEGYARCGDLKLVQVYLDEMRSQECPPNVTTYNRVIDAASNALTNDQLKDIVAEMDSSGIQSNPYTFAAIAKALMRLQRKNEALGFLIKLKHEALPLTTIGDLMQRCIDHDLWEGVQVLKDSLRNNQLSPNGYIYSLLLRMALLHRDMPEAHRILRDMEQNGLTAAAMPTTALAVLLEFFVEGMHLDRIQSIISWMRESRIVIGKRLQSLLHKSFYVYMKLSEGGMLAHAKVPHLPDDVATTIDLSQDQQLSYAEAHTRLPHDISTYLRLTQDKGISTLQVVKDFEQVMKLPFQISVHEYNDVLLNLLRTNHFEAFLNALKDMDQLGIVPNLFTLSLALKCRLALSQSKLAHRTLREAGRHGLTPTVYQCALVFHHHCRLGLMGAAEALLDEMIGFWRLRPNHVFYASLIYAHHRARDHSSVFRTFERMEKHGFLPDTEACNYLIKSLLDLGKEEEAQSFLERMVAQNIPRNSHTLRYFVDRLVPRGHVSKALEMLSTASEDGTMLDGKPHCRLSLLLCDMADIDNLVKLFDLVIESGISILDSARNGARFVFYHHLSSGNLEKARMLLEKVHIDFAPITALQVEEQHDNGVLPPDSTTDYAPYLEMLEKDYLLQACEESKRSWHVFKKALPDLREYVHKASPFLESVEVSRAEDVYFSIQDLSPQGEEHVEEHTQQESTNQQRTTDNILSLLNKQS